MTPQPRAFPTWEYARNFEKSYCVYEIQNGDSVLLFIGVCRLIDVYGMPDARRNSEFVKHITPGTNIGIKITHVGTRPECSNMRGSVLMTTIPRPIMNLLGHDTTGQTREITCNETGVTYANQTECARILAISQGALSNHLAGKPSFNAVKGMTFRKGR